MYGGTVSRCVEKVTPPPARDAQTLARPFVTVWVVTFQPRAINHRETKSTAGPSEPVDDCSASSSAASETTSVMREKVAVGLQDGRTARRERRRAHRTDSGVPFSVQL